MKLCTLACGRRSSRCMRLTGRSFEFRQGSDRPIGPKSRRRPHLPRGRRRKHRHCRRHRVGAEMGFHLLRRAGYDETLIGDVARTCSTRRPTTSTKTTSIILRLDGAKPPPFRPCHLLGIWLVGAIAQVFVVYPSTRPHFLSFLRNPWPTFAFLKQGALPDELEARWAALPVERLCKTPAQALDLKGAPPRRGPFRHSAPAPRNPVAST
jgi:hypothetical protein